MKNIIVVLLMLGFGTSYGQASKKDSLNREVDQYVQTVYRATEQFLNKQASAADRISAITPYATIVDPKQIDQLKGVVFDNGETPEIRATALSRLYRQVQEDEKLQAITLSWLTNREAPKPFRDEALSAVFNLSFSYVEFIDAYQKLLDDPDINFRLFAFNKLIIHGDARAQQRLIEGLENPDKASLPAPVAIGVLSMALKKDYYPAVYKVMQQTRDEPTRLEAIRALGSYQEARDKLVSISKDANEKEPFREAALGALYSGDRENIVKYVTPVLTDKSVSPRLKTIAIQMTIDVRQGMPYRTKAKKADDYDLLMKRLAENNDVSSLEVQKLAAKYVRTVRPTY